jgi:hypothetical protein
LRAAGKPQTIMGIAVQETPLSESFDLNNSWVKDFFYFNQRFKVNAEISVKFFNERFFYELRR